MCVCVCKEFVWDIYISLVLSRLHIFPLWTTVSSCSLTVWVTVSSGWIMWSEFRLSWDVCFGSKSNSGYRAGVLTSEFLQVKIMKKKQTSAKSSVTITSEISWNYLNRYWKLKCFPFAKNMECWRQMHIYKHGKKAPTVNYRLCAHKEIMESWKASAVYLDYPHRDRKGSFPIFIYLTCYNDKHLDYEYSWALNWSL